VLRVLGHLRSVHFAEGVAGQLFAGLHPLTVVPGIHVQESAC
jgi:hypothetical protein